VGRLLAAQGHRVLAVDQRGHGRSDKPETVSGAAVEPLSPDESDLTNSLYLPAVQR
jgi:pimeloyl-ACP methyl ester carboxylesterase